MDKVKEHLEEQFEQSDRLYWEVEEKLSNSSKELINLNRIVDNLIKEKSALDEKRKYFQKLLDEINPK
jgi:septal ring factor EnvC (AmiA/AmiB activator)